MSLHDSFDQIPPERGSEVLIILQSCNELEMKLPWDLKLLIFERFCEMVGAK
jgi:hypothetical protein